jgi:hypothetical protein
MLGWSSRDFYFGLHGDLQLRTRYYQFFSPISLSSPILINFLRFIVVWSFSFIVIFLVWYINRNKGSVYEEVGDDSFEPRVIPEAYYPGVPTTPPTSLGTTTVSFQNSAPGEVAPTNLAATTVSFQHSSPADYAPEIIPEDSHNDPHSQQ